MSKQPRRTYRTPVRSMLRRATSIATQKFSAGGRAKDGGYYKQRPITLAPVKWQDDKSRGRP